MTYIGYMTAKVNNNYCDAIAKNNSEKEVVSLL